MYQDQNLTLRRTETNIKKSANPTQGKETEQQWPKKTTNHAIRSKQTEQNQNVGNFKDKVPYWNLKISASPGRTVRNDVDHWRPAIVEVGHRSLQ